MDGRTMSGKRAVENPGISWDSAKQIDRLCDEYEAAWSTSQTLRLEELLNRAPTRNQPELFGELLRLEQRLRREAGEVPNT